MGLVKIPPFPVLLPSPFLNRKKFFFFFSPSFKHFANHVFKNKSRIPGVNWWQVSLAFHLSWLYPPAYQRGGRGPDLCLFFRTGSFGFSRFCRFGSRKTGADTMSKIGVPFHWQVLVREKRFFSPPNNGYLQRWAFMTTFEALNFTGNPVWGKLYMIVYRHDAVSVLYILCVQVFIGRKD